MSRRAAGVLAWSGFGLFVLLSAYSVLAFVTGHGTEEWFTGVAVGFALVGALIGSRHPSNPLGWMLLLVALLLAAGGSTEAYLTDESAPGRVWVGWVSNWAWPLWVLLVAVFVPLVFPSGHLPSDRWRPVVWLGVVALVVNALLAAVTPGDMQVSDVRVDNPVGITGIDGALRVADTIGNLLVGAGFLLAWGSLGLRFRRARGVERQQLKWFALAGLFVVVGLCLAMVSLLVPGASTNAVGVVGWFTFLAAVLLGLPVAIGIAILRHRLLDIDLVLNRTLVYGALSAVLAGCYLGTVLLLQLALSPLTESSDLAVAGSTLAVAAAFRPARARIQAGVDRRFYRRRYDARLTLASFGQRLRGEVDLRAVGEDLRAAVEETVEPSSVRLWLRSAP